MSGKMTETNELFTFMQSARKQMQKTPATPHAPEASLIVSDQEEVLSRPSSSRLTDLYATRRFQAEWANEIHFHVARNILHLRRYRGMSQQQVADAAETSQSAIARIESGQENVTLDTLKRVVTVLDGHFSVSITPAEFAPSLRRPWWETISSTHSSGNWQVVGCVASSTAYVDQMLIGLERPRGSTESVFLLTSTGMISVGEKDGIAAK